MQQFASTEQISERSKWRSVREVAREDHPLKMKNGRKLGAKTSWKCGAVFYGQHVPPLLHCLFHCSVLSCSERGCR